DSKPVPDINHKMPCKWGGDHIRVQRSGTRETMPECPEIPTLHACIKCLPRPPRVTRCFTPATKSVDTAS
ncbi:MAG: hypothetical protein ABW068_17220, partial [Candidatus Thiodiazotropha sp.]